MTDELIIALMGEMEVLEQLHSRGSAISRKGDYFRSYTLRGRICRQHRAMSSDEEGTLIVGKPDWKMKL